MPAPVSDMDDLQRIEFTEALAHLQGLVGTEIKATFNFYGRFFGAGMEGRLDRVETLPPDNVAISLVLDDRQGLFLDPAEVEVFVTYGGEGETAALEFRLALSASLVLEPSLPAAG